MIRTSGTHNYYVYVVTNKTKQVLYIGVTNNLSKRIDEHLRDSQTLKQTFAGKYNCVHLVYYERYQWIQDAINRETELKDWRREKKDNLITDHNPTWRFLNDELDKVDERDSSLRSE
jgi:putative endonuclease